MDNKDDTYEKKLTCTNCGWTDLCNISKGTSVMDYSLITECGTCGCKNTLRKLCK